MNNIDLLSLITIIN